MKIINASLIALFLTSAPLHVFATTFTDGRSLENDAFTEKKLIVSIGTVVHGKLHLGLAGKKGILNPRVFLTAPTMVWPFPSRSLLFNGTGVDIELQKRFSCIGEVLATFEENKKDSGPTQIVIRRMGCTYPQN